MMEDLQPVPPSDAARAVYVAFDTETSGMFIFRDKETGKSVPADDPRQPRLASVSFILCDAEGNDLERSLIYVKRDGWSMEPGATEVNGITDEYLDEHGVPVSIVLDMWETYIGAGLMPVAHNAQFDCKMMRAELRRAGRPDLFEQTKGTCTMRSMKAYKEQGMKVKSWGMIKLTEACAFFGIDCGEAHKADNDAESCRLLLVQLLKDGNLIEPQVHYAKDRE